MFFLVIATILYLLFLFLWGRFAPGVLKPNINYFMGSYGHMFSRVSEAKQLDEKDILFLGSSHAYRGFDTRIFEEKGYSCFNLGSSAQTPIQTEILLKRYVDQIRPKCVVFEVYPPAFGSEGVESSLDLIANDVNDWHAVEMAFKIHNIKTYNTLAYGIFQDQLGEKKSFVEARIKEKDTYIPGGYVEKEVAYYQPSSLPDKKISFRDDQLEALTEILSLLKARNVQTILVYAPIPSVNYKRYVNTPYFDSTMSKFATYYNFNQSLSLNDSLHFYDSHHLNQNGVELFNQHMIEIFEKDGILPLK